MERTYCSYSQHLATTYSLSLFSCCKHRGFRFLTLYLSYGTAKWSHGAVRYIVVTQREISAALQAPTGWGLVLFAFEITLLPLQVLAEKSSALPKPDAIHEKSVQLYHIKSPSLLFSSISRTPGLVDTIACLPPSVSLHTVCINEKQRRTAKCSCRH